MWDGPGGPVTVVPLFLLYDYTFRPPGMASKAESLARASGTERTSDWQVRFRATAVVYGYLHVPRTTWHDGVRFEEVSPGYPREWQPRPARPALPRQILPFPEATG